VVVPRQAKSAQIGSHLFRLEASLWKSMHEVLNGVLIKAEGINKVLSIPPYSQLVTLPEISCAWVNVT